jgi:aquaporin related protein
MLMQCLQVTLALFITGKINWIRLVHTIISQIIAGMAAAGFVAALLPGPLTINTALDTSISTVRGLFLEAFVTSMLILMILMLEGGSGKPMYVGLTLFVAELCSVFYTGGSLNPARSFGPAVVVGFPHYHWIYWIGPCLGAGVASGAYWLINWVRHEKVETLEREGRVD